MGRNISGGLLAGVISAVVWISCCLAFGWTNLQLVGGLALVFLVAVAIVTTIISSIINARKQAEGVAG